MPVPLAQQLMSAGLSGTWYAAYFQQPQALKLTSCSWHWDASNPCCPLPATTTINFSHDARIFHFPWLPVPVADVSLWHWDDSASSCLIPATTADRLDKCSWHWSASHQSQQLMSAKDVVSSYSRLPPAMIAAFSDQGFRHWDASICNCPLSPTTAAHFSWSIWHQDTRMINLPTSPVPVYYASWKHQHWGDGTPCYLLPATTADHSSKGSWHQDASTSHFPQPQYFALTESWCLQISTHQSGWFSSPLYLLFPTAEDGWFFQYMVSNYVLSFN